MDMFAAKGINVSCRTIEGDAFIFDQQTRKLIQLDKVGSFIWDQINGLRTIGEIVGICLKTFVGDEAEIENAVREFIEELYAQNVVVQSPTAFEGVMQSAC